MKVDEMAELWVAEMAEKWDSRTVVSMAVLMDEKTVVE
jgi:hypothetical protein